MTSSSGSLTCLWLKSLFCCVNQCLLQASHPWCCWKTFETQRILDKRGQSPARHPHRDPLVLRDSDQRGQRCTVQQSASSSQLPGSIAQAPAHRRVGRLPLLRLPKSEWWSCRCLQRSGRQRRRPPSGCRQQRGHLPGHQQRRGRRRGQVKTLSCLPPTPTPCRTATIHHNSSSKLGSHLVFTHTVGQRTSIWFGQFNFFPSGLGSQHKRTQ